MNRKLANDLGECLKAISDELHKFISNENFQFGYFDNTQKESKVTYFNQEELHAGVKEIQKTIPLYQTNNRLFSSILSRYSKALSSKPQSSISQFNKLDFTKNQFIDFFTDEKRNDVQNLFQIANQICRSFILLKPIARIGSRRSLKVIKNNKVSIPFTILHQELNEIFSKNYFLDRYYLLNELRLELQDHHPYSPIWNNVDEKIKQQKYLFENLFISSNKKLLQLQAFTQKSRLTNLFTYSILGEALGIPKPPSQDSLINFKTKYQRELILLPVNQIDLSKTGEMRYTDFFNQTKFNYKQDFNDKEILLDKSSWTEYHNCMSLREHQEALQRISVDSSYYRKLSHPYFPYVDSSMQSILRFIHSKLYFLSKHFDTALENFPYMQRLDYVAMSREEIIKKLIAEYTDVLSSKHLKFSLSPSIKLPKAVSDIFLSGLIKILNSKVTSAIAIDKTPEEPVLPELYLNFPYKIFWDIKKTKIELKEVLKPLFTKPIGGINPPMKEDEVDRFINHFFSFESEKEFISPRIYLHLNTNSKCPKAVICKFIYDIWKKYYDETEGLARFTELVLVAFPDRFKNSSLDINSQSFKNHVSNMNNGHPIHTLEVV